MAEFTERTACFADGPLAVVVGCGDMGMGTARALGRRHPLLIVDIDAERLDHALAALRREGYVASGVRCDITDPEQVRALGGSLAAGPGVRVLAHVAAVGGPPDGWRQVLTVDLIGMHLVVQAVEPSLLRGAAVVLISSTGSYLCPRDPHLEILLDDPLRPDFLEALAVQLDREPDFLEAYFMAKQGVNRLARRLGREPIKLGVSGRIMIHPRWRCDHGIAEALRADRLRMVDHRAAVAEQATRRAPGR